MDISSDSAAEAQVFPEWTPRSIRRQAFRGAMALGFRQVLVAAISVVGGVALARLLSPAQFGLYAVFVFALSILGIFGDVGLGASLIRSASEPSTNEYRVVFTAQQGLLVVGIVAL